MPYFTIINAVIRLLTDAVSLITGKLPLQMKEKTVNWLIMKLVPATSQKPVYS